MFFKTYNYTAHYITIADKAGNNRVYYDGLIMFMVLYLMNFMNLFEFFGNAQSKQCCNFWFCFEKNQIQFLVTL